MPHLGEGRHLLAGNAIPVDAQGALVRANGYAVGTPPGFRFNRQAPHGPRQDLRQLAERQIDVNGDRPLRGGGVLQREDEIITTQLFTAAQAERLQSLGIAESREPLPHNLGASKLQMFEVRDSDLQALLPEAVSFSELIKPAERPPYRGAQSSGGGEIARVYCSADICPQIAGYSAHVPVLVALGADEIFAVRMLANLETPSYNYMLQASGFVEKYCGKNINTINSVVRYP